MLTVGILTFFLPVLLAGYFITHTIGDETLSRSFAIHQLFFGSLTKGPLYFSGLDLLLSYGIGRRARARVGISVQSFFTSVLAVVLGNTAADHYIATIQMLSSNINVYYAIIRSLVRASMVFPVSLGTTTIFAVSMAERNVYNEQSSVFWSFVLAQIIRSTYDWIGEVVKLVLLGLLFISGEQPKPTSGTGWTIFIGFALKYLMVCVSVWVSRRRCRRMVANAPCSVDQCSA